MIETVALLLSDTYKQCHGRMYPKELTRLVSYWVPRRSMLENQKEMVFFGLNAFCKQYLHDYFNQCFFNLTEEEVLSQYCDTMDIQIGEGNYEDENIIELHRLGYLPLEIRALPEGTLVPMSVPCIEITNTHPDFAWLVQWIECILQVELWKPCLHATIGHMYRQLANKWYEKSVDGMSPAMACSDFGMRGMSCMEEAIRCSASWLLSFNKTSTIPAINYIDKYYNANCKANGIGIGGVSYEHSVVGANYAIYGSEEEIICKALTELYPNTSFSYVSDTYDYWDVVENVLPRLKKEIMAHNGKFLVRPDSGSIVDISVKTVQSLWDSFGGTINSKGYKVLDPHVGVIYGDGCTLANVEDIWSKLDELGFAANNIFFGIGAFCFSAIKENDKLVVATRDTFGIAMKATYGVIGDKEVQIYKDPKTDTSKLKKSHKGCCIVTADLIDMIDSRPVYKLSCSDGYTWEEADTLGYNLLQPVFKDGVIIKEHTFAEIRDRLNGGKF